MILDDLAEHSQWIRDFCKEAHIIRVPMAVYASLLSGSKESSDFKDNHIPDRYKIDNSEDGFDATDAYPPYNRVVIVSENREYGALFIEAIQGDSEAKKEGVEYNFVATMVGINEYAHISTTPIVAERFIYSIRKSNEAIILIPENKYIANLFNIFVDIQKKYPEGFPEDYKLDEYAFEQLEAHWIAVDEVMKEIVPYARNNKTTEEALTGLRNGETYMLFNFGLSAINRSIATRDTITSTFSLMNIPNLISIKSETPPKINKKRIESGRLPLYTYHILAIKVKKEGGKRGEYITIPITQKALHSVRGHFKRYTEENPLFGKYVGRFWTPSHVAGKANRVIEKEYKILL